MNTQQDNIKNLQTIYLNQKTGFAKYEINDLSALIEFNDGTKIQSKTNFKILNSYQEIQYSQGLPKYVESSQNQNSSYYQFILNGIDNQKIAIVQVFYIIQCFLDLKLNDETIKSLVQLIEILPEIYSNGEKNYLLKFWQQILTGQSSFILKNYSGQDLEDALFLLVESLIDSNYNEEEVVKVIFQNLKLKQNFVMQDSSPQRYNIKDTKDYITIIINKKKNTILICDTFQKYKKREEIQINPKIWQSNSKDITQSLFFREFQFQFRASWIESILYQLIQKLHLMKKDVHFYPQNQKKISDFYKLIHNPKTKRYLFSSTEAEKAFKEYHQYIEDQTTTKIIEIQQFIEYLVKAFYYFLVIENNNLNNLIKQLNINYQQAKYICEIISQKLNIDIIIRNLNYPQVINFDQKMEEKITLIFYYGNQQIMYLNQNSTLSQEINQYNRIFKLIQNNYLNQNEPSQNIGNNLSQSVLVHQNQYQQQSQFISQQQNFDSQTLNTSLQKLNQNQVVNQQSNWSKPELCSICRKFKRDIFIGDFHLCQYCFVHEAIKEI